ncbi:glycosyltransferase family 39 protein [Candidatus Woesearchaeota archaeon]|nr:glycosyltransferase family 39 protein [Candidatus Woesearchaeota archaeon]
MKKNLVIFLLLFIFLFQAINTLNYLKEDNSNPDWDRSWHAFKGLNYYKIFVKGEGSLTESEQIYPIIGFVNSYYPPLFHLSQIPFLIIFGQTHDSSVYVNIVYLAIMVTSMFFIGKKLKNDDLGLFLALLSSLIPFYNLLMRTSLMDFSLNSMVSLTFCLWLYSEDFENRIFSFLFGLSLGLGMLTKWTFFIFVSLLCAYSIIKFFMNNLIFFSKFKKLGKLINLTGSLLIAFIVTYSWYSIAKIKGLIPQLRYFSKLGWNTEFATFSLSNILSYFYSFTLHFSFLYLLLFFIGIFILLRKRNTTYLVIFSQFLFSFIFFLNIANRDPRLISPIYISMIIISGYWIFDLNSKKLRNILLISLIFIIVISNLAYNSEKINYKFELGKITVVNYRGFYAKENDYNLSKIYDIIKQDTQEPYSVCIISESDSFNDINIPYYASLNNEPITKMLGNGCNPLSYDYTIKGIVANSWRKNLFQSSLKVLNESQDEFILIGSYKKIEVYKQLR